MLTLTVGLVIFFAVHSISLVAPEWRDRNMTGRKGVLQWHTRIGMISLLSTAFIIMGYQEARLEPIWLWFPPLFTRHITSLLMVIALFFVGAAIIPKTKTKSKVGYPFLIAIKLWAVAHLISNGNLADLVLFGGFLAWSVTSYVVYRRRDRQAGVKPSESSIRFDLMAVSFALASSFFIIAYLHKALIGVSPLI
ncbi:NnrU family protein [Marinomonas sp. C2222]|uniref:NnrU family protein n=1 Tax=Marinomonas sargassi TaxID=2984494 RepID=A0ABT2YRD9_9GAMM|nr:NnrU family protein [Marinomonas sargassi]MCV2402459.1 NnrU family protein [Marinomonas sargassi]